MTVGKLLGCFKRILEFQGGPLQKVLQTQGGESEAARPRRLEGRNLKEKVVGSINAIRGVRAERRALVQLGALTAGGMGSLLRVITPGVTRIVS